MMLLWQWRLVRALSAQSSLPVYELNKAYIQNAKTKLRPFDPGTGFAPMAQCAVSVLHLTGWKLAHAVKKADCLRRLPFEIASRFGFLLEHLPTFDWRKSNLRLHAGIARSYADFVGTTIAGRIAQGVALLALEDRGYAYAAHYLRSGGNSGPDFIVQHRTQGASALLESKGSFIPPDHSPNIKRILRDGLAQISNVDPLGTRKSFVVGTFLREAGDPHQEPSLVALVDPETNDPSAGDTRPDWILRHNYAAWLDAMGLYDAASDLRTGIAPVQPETIVLHIVDVNETQFGVVNLGTLLANDSERVLDNHPLWGEWRCVVAGMPMTAIRSISHALSNPSKILSMELLTIKSQIGEAIDDNFMGSIMADGSLLGVVPLSKLLHGPTQDVQL